MTNTQLAQYQTDVLFLLIGFNPLPNYVAGVLLTKPKSTVYLLYSDDKNRRENSLKVANMVSKALRNKKKKDGQEITIWPISVDESKKKEIEKKVREILTHAKFPGGRVGLNYTGGTKPMATHAYRTIERFAVEKNLEKPIFSYLDPRELALRIEVGDLSEMVRVIHHPAVCLSLGELLEIHAAEYKKDENKPDIHQSELAATLATVHNTKDGFKFWKDWLKEVKKNGNGLEELQSSSNQAVRQAGQILHDLCGGQPCLQVAAEKLKLSQGYFLGWLDGNWLEDYAFEALAYAMRGILGQQIALRSYLDKNLLVTQDVMKQSPSRRLELDLAAVLGYQFFVISCKAQALDNKDAKLSLFEAYVRATQLGGDEARTALVCCSHDPTAVERELSEEWDAADKIKVFGMEHLMNLKAEFKTWLETANKRR